MTRFYFIIIFIASINLYSQVLFVPSIQTSDIDQDRKVQEVQKVITLDNSGEPDTLLISPGHYLFGKKTTGTEMNLAIGTSGEFKNVADSEDDKSVANNSITMNFSKLGVFGWEDTYMNLRLSVNLAAFDDTIKTEFGVSLLDKNKGKNSGYVDYMLAFPWGTNGHYLLGLQSALSTVTWKIPVTIDQENTTLTGSGSFFTFSIRTGYNLSMSKKTEDSNDEEYAAVSMLAGLEFRSLGGDFIEQHGFQDYILDGRNNFVGLSLALLGTYKNFTLGVEYYRNFGSAKIPGFTGGQVLGGISYALDLVKF